MSQDVYTKTAAGRLALLGKASGLPLEPRRVLILVNGKKTVDELRDFVDPGHLTRAIDTLIVMGYIQLVAGETPQDFSWIRVEASRFTAEVLGTKSKPMCEAIERCATVPELRKVLQGILVFVDQRLSNDITVKLERHYRAMLLLAPIDIHLP